MKIKAYNTSLEFVKSQRSVNLVANPTGNVANTSVRTFGNYDVFSSTGWTLYYYMLTEDATINYTLTEGLANASICVSDKVPEIGDYVTMKDNTTNKDSKSGTFTATAGQYIIWEVAVAKSPTITALMD